MRAVNAVLIGIVVFSTGFLSGFAAGAQTLRTSRGPAEIPPASYKGSQYVDSRGCAFIRAGYGGSVQWVPRVQRNRRVVCGMSPSRVAGARPAPVQKVGPKARLVRRFKGVTTVTAEPRSRRPLVISATGNTVARPAYVARQPAPQKMRRRAAINWRTVFLGAPLRSTVRQPSPRVALAAPVVAPRQVVRVAPAGPVASSRTRGTWVDPAPIIARSRAIALGFATRGASRQVVVASGAAVAARAPLKIEVTPQQIPLPPGYKSLLPAEFNPAYRGRGTAAGEAAMDLLWTQTMPRRLIDVTTGRDMTRQLAQIHYPYTSVVRVSTRSYVPANSSRVHRSYVPRKKRILKDEAAPYNMKKFHKVSDVSAFDPSVGRDVARKTTSPKAAAKAPTGTSARFIQVATFGVPANATRTLSRFRAKGLPTLSRPLRRAGRSYDIVLLGPFADQSGLNAGLQSARRAGFSDAFLVR